MLVPNGMPPVTPQRVPPRGDAIRAYVPRAHSDPPGTLTMTSCATLATRAPSRV